MNLPRAFPPLVPLALALALAACEGRVPENIGQEASGEDPSINTADFQVRTDGEAWFVATDGRFRRYSFEEDARVGELGTLFADRGLSPGSLGNDGKPFALDDRYLYGFSQLRGSAFRLTKDGSRGPEALPFTDVEPRIRPSALAVGSGHIFVGAGIGDSGEVWEVDQNGKAGQRIAGYGVVFPVPSAIWADDRRVTWVDARHWVRAIDLVDGSGAGQPTRDLLYFSERVSLYAMGKDALYAVHGALAFPRPPQWAEPEEKDAGNPRTIAIVRIPLDGSPLAVVEDLLPKKPSELVVDGSRLVTLTRDEDDDYVIEARLLSDDGGSIVARHEIARSRTEMTHVVLTPTRAIWRDTYRKRFFWAPLPVR